MTPLRKSPAIARRSFLASLAAVVAAPFLPSRFQAAVQPIDIKSRYGLFNAVGNDALILAPYGDDAPPHALLMFNGRGESAFVSAGRINLPAGFLDDALDRLLTDLKDDLALLGFESVGDDGLAHVVARQRVALFGTEAGNGGIAFTHDLLGEQVGGKPLKEDGLLQKAEFIGGDRTNG